MDHVPVVPAQVWRGGWRAVREEAGILVTRARHIGVFSVKQKKEGGVGKKWIQEKIHCASLQVLCEGIL